ncbi:MAG: UDP-N-acetylglucosamine--N-acetylmuramyl-(pentapeptide) pyrophosphoryl-undecaprenol N-acetylglucosamine transferase [Acidimicrobiia bacterium]
MSRAAPVFALVTGGGTGGHVYPALAVAEELTRRGHPPATIRFVGSRRGLEATAVPAAGFPIDLLTGRGIQRNLAPRAILANIGAVVGIARAVLAAFRILSRYRPRVVLGVGGYASFPCILAARLRRVPAVVHEQNAAPGLANRVAVRLGARPAVSLPNTPLRGAVLTGNPVRAELAAVARDPQRGPALLAFVGGSLGARKINDAALDLFDRWRDRGDIAIRHIAGARDLERCEARLVRLRRPSDAMNYALLGYEEDMVDLYTTCAVLVARAGAVTCAELAITGTPSILVPLPHAPADHQTRNAEALARAGAAIVVADADLDGDRLASELGPLLAGADRLDAMGQAAKTLAEPHAAAAVADLVLEAAGVA